MNARLILVPYDSGQPSLRLGAGPQQLVAKGLVEHLAPLAGHVEMEWIEAQDLFLMENQTSFDLMRQVSRRVAFAERQGEFPIVVAGNCDVIVGSVAGLSPGRLGAVWFDAHTDFRTPERSYDGFLDGMGLAMLAGLCWRWATATVPGFRPIPPGRLLHIGSRPLKEEIVFLNEAGVGYLTAAEIHDKGIEHALPPCLDGLAREIDRVHLHLDVDVLDPAIAPANTYSREDGLTPEQVGRALDLIANRFPIAALDITAYDPACDPEGRLVPVVLDLIKRVFLRRSGHQN